MYAPPHVLQVVQDSHRRAALQRLALLDTPSERAFDRLTRLASRILNVPTALVSLVDGDRQFLKSCLGFPEPWAAARDMPLSLSVCQYVVAVGEPLVVEDTRQHPLFSQNQALHALGVIAYAGIPLVTSEGHALGAFCAIDAQPRSWSHQDIEALHDLAASVMTELELRSDIIERCKVEATLRESEGRLRTIVEYAPTAISIKDRDGRYQLLNAAAAQLIGVTPNQALGRRDEEILGAVDHLERSAEQPPARFTLQPPHERKCVVNGQERIVSTSAVPYSVDTGEIIGVIEISQDITERKQSEAALRESEERFRGTFESAAIGMAVIGLDGRWVHVNRSLCDIVGYAAQELQTMTFQALTHPDDLEKCLMYIHQLLTNQIQSYHLEKRYLHQQGNVVWILLSASLVRDMHGQPLYIIAQIQNITEQKQALVTLQEAKREVEHASRAKSEFLRNMNHELRNPLSVIKGLAELLALDNLPDDHRMSVDNILHATRHLIDIMDDRLDLAQIEAGKVVISRKLVVVADIMNECLALVHELAAQRRIRIDAEKALSYPRIMFTDPTRFKQVLLNLLTNAIKYTNEAGHILLTCEDIGDQVVRIMVADTGPGIPTEQQARLFKPFERLDAEQSGITGTGLGLVISKHVVEAMGGAIGMESVAGTGSRFWFTLPTQAKNE